MLRYETLPVTPFAQNCSLVWCDRTLEGAVIDPGLQLPRLLEAAKRQCGNVPPFWANPPDNPHSRGPGPPAPRDPPARLGACVGVVQGGASPGPPRASSCRAVG